MASNPLMDVLKNVYEKEETSHSKEVLTTLARNEGAPPEDIYRNFFYKPRYDPGGKVDGILVFAYEVTDQAPLLLQLAKVWLRRCCLLYLNPC